MKHYYYMGGAITKVLFDKLSELEGLPLKRTLFVKDDEKVSRGVCSVCGCTMTDPCRSPEYGFCSWADDEETLCSWCAKGVLTRKEKNAVMHRVNTVIAFMEEG